jgi:hypothetical protein
MNSLKTKELIRKEMAGAIANKKIRKLLLNGPVMSDSQFQTFLNTRESFGLWKVK